MPTGWAHISSALKPPGKVRKKRTGLTEAERIEHYRRRYGGQFPDVFAAIDRCQKKPNGAIRRASVSISLKKFLADLHRKSFTWARTWGDEIVGHVRHADAHGYQP